MKFVLFGKSGSGKTLVADILNDCCNLKKAVACTSRPMRNGEVHGVDYKFHTKLGMEKMFHSGQLIEMAEYDGNYYGLEKSEFINSDFTILEPKGVLMYINSGYNVLPIYIHSDKETRVARMRERGDSEENIQNRLTTDIQRFGIHDLSDIMRENFVINDIDTKIRYVIDDILFLLYENGLYPEKSIKIHEPRKITEKYPHITTMKLC